MAPEGGEAPQEPPGPTLRPYFPLAMPEAIAGGCEPLIETSDEGAGLVDQEAECGCRDDSVGGAQGRAGVQGKHDVGAPSHPNDDVL